MAIFGLHLEEPDASGSFFILKGIIMRPTEHDLNSLRNIIRNLQDENSNLKKLLDENNISYSADNVIDTVDISDEYDDDQAGRIIHTTPDLDMADFYDNLIRVENEQAAAELLEITEQVLMAGK